MFFDGVCRHLFHLLGMIKKNRRCFASQAKETVIYSVRFQRKSVASKFKQQKCTFSF